MRQVLSIARKELRAYFLSPVALIFLATFLFVVLFVFFWVKPFFQRNIADVRPLFEWLPVLLVFLVGALTMRLWSDEQRSGTLELLLTLPVRTSRLVLGKFLAGFALVGVALALTIGLPLTVSWLGDIDWGPVFGGYLAALLLAGAYLAIGLCMSSATGNPIVALFLTIGACGGLYLVGSDLVANYAGNHLAEVLRLIGTGSRFESIGRGVLDLRDIFYYVTLIGGFLFLNVVLLESKRWSQGASTRPRRSALKLSAGLIVANLLALNVAVAAVGGARLDLTERGEYSISPVTKKLLQGLTAPLVIRGYFSAKTHPLLAPLVPRIRDILAEYAALGGKQVRAEFIDPQESPAAEKEANEDFGIKSMPFQFSSRHEAGIVNSYFTVLVKYGDKYETLGFDDLIEVKVTGMRDIEVKLRNLEYDLTRSIKKVVYGFKPLEELFARLAEPARLTFYATPQTLPENLRALPERLAKVAGELGRRAGGKLVFQQIDPSGPANQRLRRDLMQKYGIRPLAASLLSGESFYLHSVLSAGSREEPLFFAPELGEAELRRELEAALKRVAPGFLKTIGLVTSDPASPRPHNPMMPQEQPQPQPQYQLLQQRLGESFTVKNTPLRDGRVPGDVDALLVIGAENLDDKQRFAIDQYLMRGGAVIICAGAYGLQLGQYVEGLNARAIESKLEPMLSGWGIELQKKLVLDPQNEALPVPVERNVMGLTIREVQLLRYPFWVDVRSNGMAEDSPIVGGLQGVTLQWVSPLKVSKRPGIETTELLASSADAWTQENAAIQPDFARYPEAGFGQETSSGVGRQVLAVTAKGAFVSSFKGQANPLLAGGEGKDAAAAPSAVSKGDPSAGVVEKSLPSARLAVVGSADFVRDPVLNLSRQTGSDRFTGNLQLVQNLLDWAVEDVDLLSIRSRGAYARTLRPLEAGAQSTWEGGNYLFVALALGAIVALTLVRRRTLKPMALPGGPVGRGGAAAGDAGAKEA